MAVGAIPASNGTIFGCYSTKSGDLRVVEKNERCGKKETRLSWNKEGATGATGARGPAGPAGPKGATGAQGSQGLKGDAGAAGSKGADGANGVAVPRD